MLKFDFGPHLGGMIASGLCLVHCLSMPFLISFSPSLASALESSWFEGALLAFSALVALFLLGKDFVRQHRRFTPVMGWAVGFALVLLAEYVVGHALWLSILGSAAMTWAFWHNHRLKHVACAH